MLDSNDEVFPRYVHPEYTGFQRYLMATSNIMIEHDESLGPWRVVTSNGRSLPLLYLAFY